MGIENVHNCFSFRFKKSLLMAAYYDTSKPTVGIIGAG